MADTQTPASAKGGSCETTSSGRLEVPQHSAPNSPGQVIAIVPKSAREQFQIAIKEYHGRRQVEVRVFQKDRQLDEYRHRFGPACDSV